MAPRGAFALRNFAPWKALPRWEIATIGAPCVFFVEVGGSWLKARGLVYELGVKSSRKTLLREQACGMRRFETTQQYCNWVSFPLYQEAETRANGVFFRTISVLSAYHPCHFKGSFRDHADQNISTQQYDTYAQLAFPSRLRPLSPLLGFIEGRT